MTENTPNKRKNSAYFLMIPDYDLNTAAAKIPCRSAFLRALTEYIDVFFVNKTKIIIILVVFLHITNESSRNPNTYKIIYPHPHTHSYTLTCPYQKRHT